MSKRLLASIAFLLGLSGTAYAEDAEELPRKPVRQFCFEEAGNRYGISPQLLWGIAKNESGFNPRAVNWNTNGTYDFGVMQINTLWEPTLRKNGISWQSLADPCTNVMTGAWILRQCIDDYGYNWQAVGCYNSRTPSKRDAYARRVATLLTKHNLIRVAGRN